MTERTLALAGVMQATELVRQAAWHGTWSGYAASVCLNSLFRLEADTVESIYGGKKQLRLGLETLLASMRGESRHAEALTYMLGLLQIERSFIKSKGLQETIGSGLEKIARTGEGDEEFQRENQQAHEIALLYASTISQIQPRIIVKGKPEYLKLERTIDWVRTLLMAGLRSAVLWDQLGGGRFELLLGRKRIMNEAQALLLS